MNISNSFPEYLDFNPIIPVRCVTPQVGRVIHRFFDTSPFSPSGRYIALFRMPFENRNPLPGEKGQILLIDLQEGIEVVLTKTSGWESQLGANVQWGSSDEELYFNDVDIKNWKPLGMKMNPFTGEKVTLDGGIFMVSPDGKSVATTCPIRARRTQVGYGVMLPDTHVPVNSGLPKDDGLYITDTQSGKIRKFISICEMVESLRSTIDIELYSKGQSYGFQCKWNPQGTKLLFVLRWLSPNGQERKNHVITLNPDGTDVQLAIPAHEWAKGGHHINWCPDGEHLTMNLNIDGNGLRFVRVRYDGEGLEKLLENVPGSGHPTVHPDGIHLLTDAYLEDTVACGDGTVPIRWINLEDGSDTTLLRIHTAQPFDFTLRVDPHPAWDRTFTRFAFNAFIDGTRRVYVGDMSNLIGK